MVTNLRDSIAEQFRQRKSEKDIRNTLVDQGYTPDYVEDLIREVKQDLPRLNREYKERIQQQRAEQSAEKRMERREEQSESVGTILTGIVGIIIGVVIWAVLFATHSIVIHAIVEPVGTFIIAAGGTLAFGTIFGGVCLIIKGAYHRIRWW